MLQYLTELIRTLPSEWQLVVWIVIIFVAWAMFVGFMKGCFLLFELIAELTGLGLLWVASRLIAALVFIVTYPFKLIGRLIAGLFFIVTYPFRLVARIFRKIKNSIVARRTQRKRAKAEAKAANQPIEVTTVYVTMQMSKQTGSIDGRILQGPYKKSLLSKLTLEQLRSFYEMAKHDTDTDNLMQTYMDRTYGNTWRNAGKKDKQQHKEKAKPSSDPYKITYQRAVEIFDLQDTTNFTDADLTKRYRSIMGQLHPDRGGSNFFSQQANEAREVIRKRKQW